MTLTAEVRSLLWVAEHFDLLRLDLTDEQCKQIGMTPVVDQLRIRAEAIEEIMDSIDWNDRDAAVAKLNQALVCVGSNARPQVIVRYWWGGELPTWAIAEVLLDAHVGWNPAFGAGPMIDPEDWAEIWREVHADHGFMSDGPEQPTEPLTLYYGGHIYDDPWICWTESRDVAVQFANRSMRPAGVWRIIAPPDVVLGRIEARNEDEVVIDIDRIEVGAIEEVTHE